MANKKNDLEETVTESLEELLTGLSSKDEVELVTSALLLAELGPEAQEAVAELSHMLGNGGGPEAHWAAAYALGCIGSGAKAALPVLFNASKDSDKDVREEALSAIDLIMAEQRGFVGA